MLVALLSQFVKHHKEKEIRVLCNFQDKMSMLIVFDYENFVTNAHKEGKYVGSEEQIVCDCGHKTSCGLTSLQENSNWILIDLKMKLFFVLILSICGLER